MQTAHAKYSVYQELIPLLTLLTRQLLPNVVKLFSFSVLLDTVVPLCQDANEMLFQSFSATNVT